MSCSHLLCFDFLLPPPSASFGVFLNGPFLNLQHCTQCCLPASSRYAHPLYTLKSTIYNRENYYYPFLCFFHLCCCCTYILSIFCCYDTFLWVFLYFTGIMHSCGTNIHIILHFYYASTTFFTIYVYGIYTIILLSLCMIFTSSSNQLLYFTYLCSWLHSHNVKLSYMCLLINYNPNNQSSLLAFLTNHQTIFEDIFYTPYLCY